jgi:hypothetical protein
MGAVTPQGYRACAGNPLSQLIPSTLGLRKVQKSRNSRVPRGAERNSREAASRTIGSEIQESVGVGQPGPILIQPHHGPPIGLDQGNGLPQMLEDLRPVRFVAVECEGTPKPGVPPPSVGFQVDDIGKAHKFRV